MYYILPLCGPAANSLSASLALKVLSLVPSADVQYMYIHLWLNTYASVPAELRLVFEEDLIP